MDKIDKAMLVYWLSMLVGVVLFLVITACTHDPDPIKVGQWCRGEYYHVWAEYQCGRDF